jgi:hypothetical protein
MTVRFVRHRVVATHLYFTFPRVPGAVQISDPQKGVLVQMQFYGLVCANFHPLIPIALRVFCPDYASSFFEKKILTPAFSKNLTKSVRTRIWIKALIIITSGPLGLFPCWPRRFPFPVYSVCSFSVSTYISVHAIAERSEEVVSVIGKAVSWTPLRV